MSTCMVVVGIARILVSVPQVKIGQRIGLFQVSYLLSLIEANRCINECDLDLGFNALRFYYL